MALRLTFVLALVVAACTGPPTGVPFDLEVVTGQGGGFAGTWSGFVLTADGSVQRWTSQAGDDRTMEPAGALSAESVAAIWSRLQDDALDLEVDAPGNLSRSLEVVANGETHRLTWEAMAHADLDALWTDLSTQLAAHSPQN
ncbi:hypothetical protein [Rubrivirga sp.]|uniref:hypothetical protein n=1 Tax=Rubrivirga sp. TaxID=1885344 RepID=UPI003C77A593